MDKALNKAAERVIVCTCTALLTFVHTNVRNAPHHTTLVTFVNTSVRKNVDLRDWQEQWSRNCSLC